MTDDDDPTLESDEWSDMADTQPDGSPEGMRQTAEIKRSMDEATELFQSSDLFQGLSPEEVREVVQLAEYCSEEAGTVLFEEGDDPTGLFMLKSGTLEVRTRTTVGEEVVLAEIGPVTVVGEMSLIGGGARTATVEALTDVELFELSTEAFESLRDQDRPAAYKIVCRLVRTLGDRRRETDARVREVFDDPAEYIDDFEEQVHDMLGQLRKV